MRRGIAALAVSCALLAVAVVSVRHVWGVSLNFYSSVWLPGHVLLHGGDPYRLATMTHADPKILTESPFPVYGPPHLVLAALVALVPLRVAAGLWGTAMLAIVGLLGWATIRATSPHRRRDPLFWTGVAAVVAVLILSRPGRDALDLGQPSLLYIATTMAAWHFRDRPWIAGFAVAMTVGKPPFAIPLIASLLVVRCWPVLIRAAALTVAVSVPVLVALSVDEGSFSAVLQAIRQNTSFFQHRFGVAGSTRIEAASLVTRVTGSQSTALSVGIGAVVLALGLATVHRARRLGLPDSGPLLAVPALMTLLAVAHQDYDLLLLAVPLSMVLRDRRPVLVIAAVLPAVLLMMVPANTAARILHTGPGTVLGVTTAFLVAAFLALLLTWRDWLRPDSGVVILEPGRPSLAPPREGSAVR